MKTWLIIGGITLLLLYLAVRFVLIAVIWYADNLRRKGLLRK
mgnify:CR=1 FL=1